MPTYHRKVVSKILKSTAVEIEYGALLENYGDNIINSIANVLTDASLILGEMKR